MDGRNLENLNYPSGGSDGEPDGPPWKPTRAGPKTIAVLMIVSAIFITIFMMFILHVF